MARWVAAGVHVVYVVVTSGDKGTPDKTMTNERLANTRERSKSPPPAKPEWKRSSSCASPMAWCSPT